MPTRIVIIEDNRAVRAAIRQLLESVGDGWEIVEAENGNEGLEKVKKLRPDLVIVDLVMPGMNGLVVSSEIKRLLPQIPILMHTLYSSAEVELAAAKMGVRCVTKSESGALILAVQDLLERKPLALLATAAEPLLSQRGNLEQKALS